MFSCTQCERSYASQTSLTRHVHSHKTSTKHQCPVCGVIFYRKDLLSRHSKLHRTRRTRTTSSSSSSTIDQHSQAGERRRCHTACLRCRELRTKCDGQRPCFSCFNSGQSCSFPRPTNRLSHVPINTAEPTRVEPDPAIPLPDQQHVDEPEQDLGPTAMELVPAYSQPTEYDLQSAYSMLDMETWPWMHENMYLASNASYLPHHTESFGISLNGDISLQPEHVANTLFETSASVVDPILASSELDVAEQSPIQIVQSLISFATGLDWSNQFYKNYTEVWVAKSKRIIDSFGLLTELPGPTTSILHYFAQKYTEQFGPLWPLLSPQTMNHDTLHPQLFLVLTSIGAMYCGPAASSYGAMMHTLIRGTLTIAVELEDDGADLTWLAQARLLTQVAALYFGQPRAFTYAQHIGALLAAQARKMDLFSAKPMHSAQKKFDSMTQAPDEERLSIWLQMETRRRLAFGIFRGDTYTSVLLHTKPLISLEEMDIQFPMCDIVWRSQKMTPNTCLQLIDGDRTLGRELRASDIYRIALDRNEVLPPLDPAAHELLMFGLQYPVWRFSRDHNTLERLTGSDEQAEVIQEFHSTETLQVRRPSHSLTSHETHGLDSASRKMDDLQLELCKLMSALQKWEHSLPLVKTFARSDLDRSSLMSGLILYHLGFLRLDSPLDDLHQIQYRLADNRTIDNDLIVSVRLWSKSPRGLRAAQRACDIWSMIAREVERPSEKPVKFNLIAFIGLHHSAVVLWAYAGAYEAMQSDTQHQNQPSLAGPNGIFVTSSESFAVLRSIVKLYDSISPGRWSSFAQASEALAHHKLPSIKET